MTSSQKQKPTGSENIAISNEMVALGVVACALGLVCLVAVTTLLCVGFTL